MGVAVNTEPQSSTQRSAAAPDPPLDAPPPQHKIRHTRISGLWFAVAFFGVVLLFLLIFILQNGRAVDVSYLGMHGHLPLGVAMLLSAVCGVLLTILAGAARISQLHAVARRHRRADARRTAAPAAASPPPDPAR
jgi:lipopolysaccharide assembly protein A